MLLDLLRLGLLALMILLNNRELGARAEEQVIFCLSLAPYIPNYYHLSQNQII